MWRRNWFFWLEALQITAGERRLVLGLILSYLTVSGVMYIMPQRSIYDLSYYQPIIEEFQKLAGHEQKEKEVLLARYYPPVQEVDNTFSLMNGYQPTIGAEMIRVSGKVGRNGIHQKNGPAGDGPEEQEKKENQKEKSDDEELKKNGEKSRVRIQFADREELITLQGIGPVTADRIIEYRNKNGPFKDLDDLLNVSGIGPVTIENIKDNIVLD